MKENVKRFRQGVFTVTSLSRPPHSGVNNSTVSHFLILKNLLTRPTCLYSQTFVASQVAGLTGFHCTFFNFWAKMHVTV